MNQTQATARNKQLNNVIQSPIPFSQESEEALLGAILLDYSNFPVVRGLVKKDDFFLKRHEYVYQAIITCFDRDKMFDYLTLSQELKATGVLDKIGGEAYLTYLVNNTPSSAHFEVYARLVERASVRRKMLESTDKIRHLALNEELNINDVIADAEKAMFNATSGYLMRKEETWFDVISDEIDRQLAVDTPAMLLPFPIPEIAFKMMVGEVTVLAGLSGVGKTALLLWIIYHLLKSGYHVVFISMEMEKIKILHRLVAQLTGVRAEDITNKSYPVERRHEITNVMATLAQFKDQFHIIDSAHTDREINSRVASIAYHHPVHMVAVDHLKRAECGYQKYYNEHERMQRILKEFQTQAKEFQCAYLVLHQLKVPPRDRDDKTPRGDDVYGTMNVVNIADNVIALHRDNHPLINIPGASPSRCDLFELKNRNRGNSVKRLLGHVRFIGNEGFEKW